MGGCRFTMSGTILGIDTENAFTLGARLILKFLNNASYDFLRVSKFGQIFRGGGATVLRC